jgi:hypothetical protein
MNQTSPRRKPQTKEDIRECVEFCVEMLTRDLSELDRIETLPMGEDADLKGTDGLTYPGTGVARALGRVQGIAFNIRTDLAFIKSELESCLLEGR